MNKTKKLKRRMKKLRRAYRKAKRSGHIALLRKVKGKIQVLCLKAKHRKLVFAGGQLDGKECPLKGAARECLEEVGLKAKIKRKFFQSKAYNKGKKITRVFVGWARNAYKKLKLQSGEIHDAIWLPLKAAKKKLIDRHAEALMALV